MRQKALLPHFYGRSSVKEGTNKGTILALYPHQWRNNPHILPLPYTYSTLRGIMKTIQGTSFKTVYRYHGILPNLPDKGTYDREALNRYINELALQADAPVAVDTYGLESILASFHAPFHCGAAWKYFCKRPLYKLYEIIFGRLVYRKRRRNGKTILLRQ